MAPPDGWPRAAPIGTRRLALEQLRVEHAEELARALDDVRLHDFIGGRPQTLAELRARHARLAAGRSPDGRQGWLNWIVRERESGAVVGTVQATLARAEGTLSAELAWVIAVGRQGRGYAKEAAGGMVEWLGAHGVRRLVAYVNPAHAASGAVAGHLGLAPTDERRDGETRWTGAWPAA